MIRFKVTQHALLVCLALALSFNTSVHARVTIFGSGAFSFPMEFVDIGNPGNAADRTGGILKLRGAVPYPYQMGKPIGVPFAHLKDVCFVCPS